ncbi:MAG TPA: hypothetical protein VE130_11685, partial [Nitrososphaeraceae archaeon]|nr:hypothetical protein [Nitrososphaeraceae archaeon]
QYLTTDNEGRIWFAAQRGNSLGYILQSVNPLQVATSSQSQPLEDQNQGVSGQPEGQTVLTPLFNIGYEYVIGPIVAIGIIACAAFYVNSIFSLKASIRRVETIISTRWIDMGVDRSGHGSS